MAGGAKTLSLLLLTICHNLIIFAYIGMLAKMRISNQRAWDRRRQAKKEMEEQLCQG
jgi:hypothetical protein